MTCMSATELISVYCMCTLSQPQSVVEVGSSVRVRWSDRKVYSAKVLSEHKAPCYVVSCPGNDTIKVNDEEQIFSTREKLPRKLVNKLKVIWCNVMGHIIVYLIILSFQPKKWLSSSHIMYTYMYMFNVCIYKYLSLSLSVCVLMLSAGHIKYYVELYNFVDLFLSILWCVQSLFITNFNFSSYKCTLYVCMNTMYRIIIINVYHCWHENLIYAETN